ncbi:putative CBL-interacting protein kinase 13 [Hordeum vulgare]|nr:putative CBL-interacting protein kinase 13 [Hordeum vulgare]
MVAPIINAREGDINLLIDVELLPDVPLVFKQEVVEVEEHKCNKTKKKVVVVPEEMRHSKRLKPHATIFCEEWSGLATDANDRCDHGSLCEKLMAFQDVDCGRRFHACSQKLILATIWSMHDEEKRQRPRQNVLNAEENLKILREKEKIEDKLRSFKLDFAKIVAEKEHAISQLGRTQLAMIDLKEELEKKKMDDK